MAEDSHSFQSPLTPEIASCPKATELFLPCIVNVSKANCTGFREAVVNVAEEFHGWQLGLVNQAQGMHGVQIGIAINSGWFDDFPDKLATGFPIVNGSF